MKRPVGQRFHMRNGGHGTVVSADENGYKIVYEGPARTDPWPLLDAPVEWIVPPEVAPKAANPNPKKAFGETKPNVALVPPAATLHAAMAYETGARRYGPYNWRETSVEAMTYIAASIRHIQNFLDGEDYVSDDPLTHNLGAAIAGLGIVLDAIEHGSLIDNRPPKGPSSATQDRMKAGKVARAAQGTT